MHIAYHDMFPSSICTARALINQLTLLCHVLLISNSLVVPMSQGMVLLFPPVNNMPRDILGIKYTVFID